jgi:peptide/nickel transport system permease protein
MLVFVSAITFYLLSQAGGDAFTVLRDNPQVSSETIERLRQIYGLDRPWSERYLSWLRSFVTGDLGESFHFKMGVGGLVISRLWNTVALGGGGIVLAWLIAILLSYYSAFSRSRFLDRIISLIVILTASLPRIVLALFALAIFVSSTGSALEIRNGSIAAFLTSVVVIAIPLIALFLGQTHRELDDAMDEKSVEHARAKGLSESKVIIRHASRFALSPLLTIFGLSLGSVVSAAVIVETILGWPGLGALMVTAVRARDIPLVMGIVVISTIAVWAGNAVADILQLLNDKRLRDAEILPE